MKQKNTFLIGIVWIFVLAVSFILDNYAFDLISLLKNNVLDFFFKYLTYLGEFFIALVILTVLALVKKKEERNIPLLWFSFIVLGIVVVILKFIIARIRPIDFISFIITDYSFPSLHAAVAVLAFFVLVKEFPKKKYIWIILSLLVIFSRIYLKVHYLSDIVGGVILGLIIGSLYVQHRDLKTYHAIKRVMDFIIALIGLIIVSPIMLIVGLSIRIFDGKPVIFKQDRIGLEGNMFTLYKFRSMVTNAPAMQKQGIPAGKLYTKVGKKIRKFYLDELPQLFNIIKGDMALIGPRPLITGLFFELASKDKRWTELTNIKPGLTGLESALDYLNWNKRKKIEKDLKIWKYDVKELKSIKAFFKHRLLLNLYYARHESFLLDLKIIWWTIVSIFRK
jgi:lipopolysaccharide/colanic/teichoic acid biosynthesis glycosyltransferase/membrane-associated phospholipid phosphatase